MQDQSGCVQNSNKSNGKPVKDCMQIGFEINNNFSDFCMQNTLRNYRNREACQKAENSFGDSCSCLRKKLKIWTTSLMQMRPKSVFLVQISFVIEWFSKCGPHTSSTGTTCELVRNANPNLCAPPQPREPETLSSGPCAPPQPSEPETLGSGPCL